MNLKNYNWSDVVSGLGKVASVFNPAIGGGLVVASEVLAKINNDGFLRQDELLKNDVLGLSHCVKICQDINTNGYDAQKMALLTDNLVAMQSLFTKFSNLIK